MSPTDPILEEQIAQWRGYLRRRRAIDGPDVEELEGHLRDEVAGLSHAGLAGDEAFLIGVKRLGNLDALSLEFAREHSERLWKQLVVGAADTAPASRVSSRTEFYMVLALAFGAALAIKLPVLFGYALPGASEVFYARNLSLFVLPFLALYFVWKRGVPPTHAAWLAVPFAVALAFANLYPHGRVSQTGALTIFHLPIALWLVVGFAYAGGQWFGSRARMDFVRFSGELAIYYAIIALGGGVLTALTLLMFEAIGFNATALVQGWVLPCGAMGAVLVGSWLVEAKQSVVENMAPVLTRLFTPLFTCLLLVFLATMLWTGHPIDVKREVLIAFDVLLAVVVGLVLYAVSARDPVAPANLFDRLQLLLILSALVVDAVALVAVASRISEFGFTPNRVAALGENFLLLGSLAGSAWLYIQFLRKKASFATLENWQVSYLPLYPAWAAFVVIAFPPIFSYL
jgi:hypothetical protein